MQNTSHNISELSDSDLDDYLKKNKKKLDEAFLMANLVFFKPTHWDTISQYIPLSEEFMLAHSSKLNWKKAFKYQYFSIDFIEQKRYKGKLIWKSLLTNRLVSEAFIEKYWLEKKMPWKFKSDQDWVIFTARKFSREFILRYPNKLSTFMQTQPLWEEYVASNYWLIVAECNRESSKHGDLSRYEAWDHFRNKQKHLSDLFFAQFKYKSKEDAYRNLTTSIIDEVGIDKINWLEVSCHAPLDNEFVSKYSGHLFDHIVKERIDFIQSAAETSNRLKKQYSSHKKDTDYLAEVNDFLFECYKEQQYTFAIDLYESIKETAYLNPYIFHQTACIYTALNDVDNAQIEIKKAIKYKYEGLDLLMSDPDVRPAVEAFVA
jgi:hypothetical protein